MLTKGNTGFSFSYHSNRECKKGGEGLKKIKIVEGEVFPRIWLWKKGLFLLKWNNWRIYISINYNFAVVIFTECICSSWYFAAIHIYILTVYVLNFIIISSKNAWEYTDTYELLTPKVDPSDYGIGKHKMWSVLIRTGSEVHLSFFSLLDLTNDWQSFSWYCAYNSWNTGCWIEKRHQSFSYWRAPPNVYQFFFMRTGSLACNEWFCQSLEYGQSHDDHTLNQTYSDQMSFEPKTFLCPRM